LVTVTWPFALSTVTVTLEASELFENLSFTLSEASSDTPLLARKSFTLLPSTAATIVIWVCLESLSVAMFDSLCVECRAIKAGRAGAATP
jgi:hypothetical protein